VVIKEKDGGGNSNIICLIYCENFCKCHNIPPPRTTTFKNKENKIK
jgi:hypothetical protein